MVVTLAQDPKDGRQRWEENLQTGIMRAPYAAGETYPKLCRLIPD